MNSSSAQVQQTSTIKTEKEKHLLKMPRFLDTDILILTLFKKKIAPCQQSF